MSAEEKRTTERRRKKKETMAHAHPSNCNAGAGTLPTFTFNLAFKVTQCDMLKMWNTIFVPQYEYVLFKDLRLGDLKVERFDENQERRYTESRAQVSMTDSLIVSWMSYLVSTAYSTSTLRYHNDFSILSTSTANDKSYTNFAQIDLVKSADGQDSNAFHVKISSQVHLQSWVVNLLSPLLAGFVNGVAANKFRAMLVHACAYIAKSETERSLAQPLSPNKDGKVITKEETDLFEPMVVQLDSEECARLFQKPAKPAKAQ